MAWIKHGKWYYLNAFFILVPLSAAIPTQSSSFNAIVYKDYSVKFLIFSPVALSMISNYLNLKKKPIKIS